MSGLGIGLAKAARLATVSRLHWAANMSLYPTFTTPTMVGLVSGWQVQKMVAMPGVGDSGLLDC